MKLKNLPRSFRITADQGATLNIQAAAKAEDGKDSLPTFKMTAYTGVPMDVGFGYPVVIDLAGLRVRGSSRPILRDHDTTNIIGHTTAIHVENDKLKVEGTISGVSFGAREVVESSKNGFPWQASVGVYTENMEMVEKGQTATANGRTFRGPVYIARKSVLGEVSFVALGADDNTSAKVAARAAQHMEASMDFEQWLQAKGIAADTLDDARTAELKAQWQAEVEAAKADDDQEENEEETPKATKKAQASVEGGEDTAFAEHRKRLAAETRRVNAILATCKGKHPEIEAKAIEEGWTVDKTELEVLRAERPKAPNANTGRGTPGGPAVIEAALCLRAGLPEKKVGDWYGEKTVNEAVKAEHRQMGIQSLIYMVVHAAGGYIRPGVIDGDAIRAAFRADQQIRASGGFSTVGSLSGILGNVANKTLLAAFDAVPSVVPLIASESDHNDFKERTSFRLTGSGAFEIVPPDGEIKHGALDAETFKNKVDTYGKMFALTRQMIINDDLGAFLAIPRVLGRMAALGREKAVFELLLSNPVGDDGQRFFSPAHHNLNYGANSDLDITSLGFMERLFLNQVDKSGDPILLSPAILLVPTTLKTMAQQLMTATTLVGGDVTVINNNPYAGRFRVVSSPYLNAQNLSGSSATAWYLFGNPADVAAVDVAYLRGQRTPVIESGDTDFNTLGMQWRGYWDFGVALGDPRGAVKATGAAGSGDDTLTGGEGNDTV